MYPHDRAASAPQPSRLEQLDAAALSTRLHALAGEERELQAEFLRLLDTLDQRRGFAELGYPTLWEYCLRALHFSEGAAGRRIGAMRVLRRFPRLEPGLRDGRLSLTTLCRLAPALTDENVDELAHRAAYRTKAEVEELVASVRPRTAPADGLRLGAPRLAPGGTPDNAVAACASARAAPTNVSLLAPPLLEHSRPALTPQACSATAFGVARLTTSPPDMQGAELHAVAARTWSLRVTLDADAKRDLETLTALLSHKLAKRDLATVLKEALRCAIEKHGKRRGAVAPSRAAGAGRETVASNARAVDQPRASRAPPSSSGPRSSSHPASGAKEPLASNAPLGSNDSRARTATRTSRTIPAAVRREVWTRDGARCTFVARDGTRCGSRERLELDHVQPFALGGAATAENLRLRCRTHNLLHAEQDFGRAHMARFRSAAALPAPPHRASATHGTAATHGPAP